LHAAFIYLSIYIGIYIDVYIHTCSAAINSAAVVPCSSSSIRRESGEIACCIYLSISIYIYLSIYIGIYIDIYIHTCSAAINSAAVVPCSSSSIRKESGEIACCIAGRLRGAVPPAPALSRLARGRGVAGGGRKPASSISLKIRCCVSSHSCGRKLYC